MLISDVLAAKGRDVATVLPDATVEEALRQLAARRIGAVVVEDRWQRLAGIFTERDLVRQLAAEGPPLLQRPVSEVMTPNVVTCHPGDRIDDILSLMTMDRIRHVPVMEHGRLAGIVSIGDLVLRRLVEKRQEADVLLDITRMRA
jgi:CBS domain-containing protein